MVMLIAAFLFGAPLAALAAGHAAAVTGSRIEHAQAGWHRVTAVLLRSGSAKTQPMFQASLESAGAGAVDGAGRDTAHR